MRINKNHEYKLSILEREREKKKFMTKAGGNHAMFEHFLTRTRRWVFFNDLVTQTKFTSVKIEVAWKTPRYHYAIHLNS